MNLYLAGPVDLAKNDADSWKGRLVSKLTDEDFWEEDDEQCQFTAYDPARPWHLFGQFIHEKQRTAWIELVNRTVIRYTNIMVAHVPSETVSVGTPIEINDAFEQDIDIVVISDIPYGKNAYLTNRVHEQDYVVYKGSISDADIANLATRIKDRLYRKAKNGILANVDAKLRSHLHSQKVSDAYKFPVEFEKDCEKECKD